MMRRLLRTDDGGRCRERAALSPGVAIALTIALATAVVTVARPAHGQPPAPNLPQLSKPEASPKLPAWYFARPAPQRHHRSPPTPPEKNEPFAVAQSYILFAPLGAVAGFGLGYAAVELVPVGVLTGIAGGYGWTKLTHWMIGKPITHDRMQVIETTGAWILWHGTALTLAYDATTIVGVPLILSLPLSAPLLGTWLHGKLQADPGRVAFANSVGLWTAAVTNMGFMATDRVFGRRALISTLIASDLGFLAAAFLSQDLTVTRWQVLAVDTGAACGLGVAAIIANAQGMGLNAAHGRVLLAGTAVGLGLGVLGANALRGTRFGATAASGRASGPQLHLTPFGDKTTSGLALGGTW